MKWVLANYEMGYEIAWQIMKWVLANYETGYEIAWQIMKWILANYETGYEIAWQIMKWVMKSPGKLLTNNFLLSTASYAPLPLPIPPAYSR